MGYESLDPEDRRDVHDDVTVCVFYLQFPEEWKLRFSTLATRFQALIDDIAKKSDREEGIVVGRGFSGKDDAGAGALSVVIADPNLTDCPLVAVSQGFEQLTGYRVEDAIGRNCRFLSFGVPRELFDQVEDVGRLRKFTDIATKADPFEVFNEDNDEKGQPIPIDGGATQIFLRWNRMRDGTLFQNMFALRQVWVGDRTYLIAIQCMVPGSKIDSVQQGENVPIPNVNPPTKEGKKRMLKLAELVAAEIEVQLPMLVQLPGTGRLSK